MAEHDPEFEPPEFPELLSLGLIVGGITPANELVREAFMALMRGVRDRARGYPNEGLRINIVFQVPGRFMSPDFEGVFPARFARKTNHLLVNAAVPASLTFEQVPQFFVDALSQTKAAATEYLRGRKLNVETKHVMAFIDDLASERTAS